MTDAIREEKMGGQEWTHLFRDQSLKLILMIWLGVTWPLLSASALALFAC